MADITLAKLVLAALVLALILAARWAARQAAMYRFRRRTGSLPPPPVRPWAGVLGTRWMAAGRAAQAAGTTLQQTREYFRQSGPTYRVGVMGQTYYFTADVDNARACLANLADWGVSYRARAAGWAPLLQDGTFIVDGKPWEASRALIRPAVSRAEIRQLDKVEGHVEAALRRLLAAASDGATVELQQVFRDLAADSAQDFLLGVGTADGLTADEAADRAAFSEALDRGNAALFARAREPRWLRIATWWRWRQFERDSAAVHRFVDSMVERQARLQKENGSDKKKGEKEEKEEEKQGGYIFADELLRATGGDRLRVRWELLSLFSAAGDTTGLLLANVFYLLARHPAAWERLRAEVAQLEGRKPDYDRLKAMRYLRAVINEAIRVQPVVGGIIRSALRDTVLPRGGGPDGLAPCFAAKGTLLYVSIHALHRDPAVWGPDADEFRPERWLDSNDGRGGGPPLRPGWNYLPFGGGPRVCPGQQFGLIEASYAAVRMVQTFRRIEPRDPRPYRPRIGITIRHADGVLVGLSK